MKNNRIPFLSFDGIHDDIEEELFQAAKSVIQSKWYILGQKVQQFENEFSNFTSSKYSVGVNSGLDGLIIALRALNIGPGDEVLVASNAYIACWNAIYAVGATIIPIEPSADTFNIDTNLIIDKISDKTKAIMAVHLFGQMCNMTKIMDIAKIYNLYVIEDNAQSQGAVLEGKRSASFGHINATSFYPGKNLGALGDAGIITTNDKILANKSMSLRNYGSSIKYINDTIGLNSRLDEMQAALLSVKLKYINEWNKNRLQIAKWYKFQLDDIEDLIIPNIPDDGSHVCHVYCIRCENRDDVQEKLQQKGIQTLIHYPIPPHLQKAYQFLGYSKNDFPIAEKMALTSLSLPIYPGLTEENVIYISENLRNIFQP